MVVRTNLYHHSLHANENKEASRNHAAMAKSWLIRLLPSLNVMQIIPSLTRSDSFIPGSFEYDYCNNGSNIYLSHDDVIKWKYFPRYRPFVRGIHRSPANSPHKGQWRGALIFSLICVWINGWVNNGEAGDLRRYRVHYDVSVMPTWYTASVQYT